MVKYHLVETVSGYTLTHMREWLSWWSTTLPRSGPRVRVPSRALLERIHRMMYPFFITNSNDSIVRGLRCRFGRCNADVHWTSCTVSRSNKYPSTFGRC